MSHGPCLGSLSVHICLSVLLYAWMTVVLKVWIHVCMPFSFIPNFFATFYPLCIHLFLFCPYLYTCEKFSVSMIIVFCFILPCSPGLFHPCLIFREFGIAYCNHKQPSSLLYSKNNSLHLILYDAIERFNHDRGMW